MLKTLKELNAKVGDVVRYHTPGNEPGDPVTITAVSPVGRYFNDADEVLSDLPYWELICKSPTAALSTDSVGKLLSEISELVASRGQYGVSKLTVRAGRGETFGFRDGLMFIEWVPRNADPK